MPSTLKMIKEKYGGAEGDAIRKCRLTKEEVDRIRMNLVVEEPAVHAEQNV